MAMTPSPNPTRGGQVRRVFSISDDPTMLKKIEATHDPQDLLNVDVKPILVIVEDIFRRAALSLDGKLGGREIEAVEDSSKTAEAVIDARDMLEELAPVIKRVSSEISYKSLGGEDAHSTAMTVLDMLSKYSWEMKVVIAMAALGISYGEFWLFVQFYAGHPIAKSVAVLKQLLDLIEYSDMLKAKFGTLNNLINVMFDVTKITVELRFMLRRYIFLQQLPMITAMTQIPIAVYWTIRSVVDCFTQISTITGLRYESSTTVAWEPSSLAHKERNIHNRLVEQLSFCLEHIEKIDMDAYHTLCYILDTPDGDNTRYLRHLVYPKDDILPLKDGTTKAKVHVEVLKRKTVLLLISDLDISYEELMILTHIYMESRARPEFAYEIVWLPIVDKSAPWTEAQQERFAELQSVMPWYSLHHPTLLEPAAVRYVKEVWKFVKKMIIVVLDPQGKVACPNALHMFLIWGNLAYPFTAMKEEALWKEETWSLELVVDGIDPRILEWIVDGKLIGLYRGKDIAWMRRFTITAKAVAVAAGLELELVFVGNIKERRKRMRNNIEIIASERLSHYWPDLAQIWWFWARLESMLYSKMQYSKNMEDDYIMSEVMTMLSYDRSDQGWATIWFGSTEMARATGHEMIESFERFEEWQENVTEKGFVPALREHLKQLHIP